MKVIIMITLLCFPFGLRSQAQQVQTRKTRFPVGFYTTDNSSIYGLSLGVGSDTYQNSEYTGVVSNGIRIEPLSQSLLVFTVFLPVDMVTYQQKPEEYAAFNEKVPNEIINGLNLSCGTNAFANVNGITVSLLNQSLKNTNGISIAGMVGYAYKSNGIHITFGNTAAIYSNGMILGAFSTQLYKGWGIQGGVLSNEFNDFSGLQFSMMNGINDGQKSFKGLQIGLLNNTCNLMGIQIGLFNNTKNIKGIQIGLINRNKKRILPFINWNFKD